MEARKAGLNPIDGHAQLQANGYRRQRIAHIVLARHRQLHREASPLRQRGKAHGFVAGLNLHRANIAVLEQAEANRLAPDRLQHIVVPVENCRSAGAQPLEDFQLRLQDSLSRAEIFNVHRADVRNDGNIRLGNARQNGQLAKVVHTHLQHRRLAVLRQSENRHGKA